MKAPFYGSAISQVSLGHRFSHRAWYLFLLLTLCFPVAALYAGVTASISGTVTDASGAAVVGATVTATNVDTGVATTQTTNGQGFYSFQSLALGKYTINVQQAGFKTIRRTDIILQVNDALVIDLTLQVGQQTERVEVSINTLHVETSTLSVCWPTCKVRSTTSASFTSRMMSVLRVVLNPGCCASIVYFPRGNAWNE